MTNTNIKEVYKIETALFFIQKGLIIGNKLVDDTYTPKPTYLEKFGLFDSSAPNYVTYDSSISEKDFVPEEGDFIYPEFRLLSETIVRENYAPIDFSKEGILKASMGLLENSPVYPDHESSIGNSLGIIEKVYWQDSYEINGVKIPAGINARLKIDAKANPRIARGLLMRPPSINSTSVSVSFNWEKSHDLNDNEFYNLYGKIGPDGQLVRKIVNDIRGFPEVSLVSVGADRFAQMITEERIVNPHKAVRSFSEKNSFEPFRPYVYTDFIWHDNTNNYFFNTKNKVMDKLNLLTLSFAQLGIEIPNIDWDNVNQESLVELLKPIIPKPVAIPENIQQFMEKVPDITFEKYTAILNNQLTPEITEELTKLKSNAEFVNNQIESFKKEVISNYKLSVGPDNESSVILGMLEKATLEELADLNKGYIAALDALVPLVCEDCGSHKISRKSSKDTFSVTPKKNIEETIRKNHGVKASEIHGKTKA